MYSPLSSVPSTQYKLQLLQSNIKRVFNQHQALLQILQDQANINQLKHQVTYCQQTAMKLQMLKNQVDSFVKQQALEKRVRPQAAHLHQPNRDIESEIRNAQNELREVKEKIKAVKAQQLEGAKKEAEKFKKQLWFLTKQENQSMQIMRSNIGRFLANVSQQFRKKSEASILDTAEQELSTASSLYNQDILSQIGLLLCELEYNKSVSEGTKNQSRLALIRRQPEEEKKNLLLGKFQRDQLCNELRQFLRQTLNRIVFDCQLLKRKIHSVIDCMQVNQSQHQYHRKRQLPKGMLEKYNREVSLIEQRFKQIEDEGEGMQIHKDNLLFRIENLDRKLLVLDHACEPAAAQFRNFKNAEVLSNIQSCRECLSEVIKAKAKLMSDDI